MSKQIAVLVGSLSKQSLNKKIAQYLQQTAPANIQLNLMDLSDLPLYDRDLDENSPASYERIRNEIKAADGVIWITPEHNAGIPAVLKNAIDICTRPAGQNCWKGKPLGVVTAAAAMAGGQRVGDQLRNIATQLEMPIFPMQTPISQIFSLFDEQGNFANPYAKARLDEFLVAYGQFVEKF